MSAILYKPLNKLFRNRLEFKLAVGSGKYNAINKYDKDKIIYINDITTLANYEYFYTNPIQSKKD